MTKYVINLIRVMLSKRIWASTIRFLGLLGVSLGAAGLAQANFAPENPRKAALERRVEAVRAALDAQRSGETDDKSGAEGVGPVAQWPNWANWPNWPNWPNWRNY